MATTLLESGAKPFGSSKGALLSMLIHGGLIAGAIYGTAQVVLPPREKVEEHPILYVASPPPPPVHAPDPLPAVKSPPKAKAPAKVYVAPKRAEQPRPQPQPRVPATPALVAPTKVALSLPAVNLQAAPTISDVVAPPAAEPVRASGGIPTGGSVKSDDDGVGGRGGKGGLGSGSSGKAYDENQVDRAVSVTRQPSPRYPESLKSVGVEGTVAMRFIVGADGRVEPGSIDVISTPHKLFAEAVRRALLESRYRPAEAGGHPVRQVVEQTFSFRIEK
jgi:periplasmic protein TonB